MQVHLVSIDDLTGTLTRCASLADKAHRSLEPIPQTRSARKALLQIKWEANEAVDRAEDGQSFEDVS